MSLRRSTGIAWPLQRFPVRAEFLPFALPEIDDAEIAEVVAVLKSGWLTTGPKVQQFEQAFSAFVGARFSVAVSSCTAALHLALESCGVQQGDEVITSTMTFAATAEVVRYFGARPVLVDIDPVGHALDPSAVEQAIGPRTRAIIPVHMAGRPADMTRIMDIAKRRGIAVIEDAAHALPTRHAGRMVGSIGDLTCFSFYATKTLATGEGGMICTDSEAHAERCRMMSLHGISKDAWKRYTSEGSWYYEIMAPGYKYNMADVLAAIGVAQLRKVDRMWQRRREIARRYDEAFGGCPELEIPAGDPPQGQHAWHLYMLGLHLDRLGIDRGRFVEELRLRNIGASVHFIPLHLHPYYRETYGYKATDFPVAFAEYQRRLSLPVFSRMSDGDAGDVIAAVHDIVSRFRTC
jgi:perosamine synthetase